MKTGKRLKFTAIILLAMVNITATAQLPELWYRQPSVKWTDALPIGNGRIGAMVFGGVTEDRIQFNEETLWTGEPRNYNRKGANQYLDTIRQLLFQGRQKEAEALAGTHFMGLKSNEGERAGWLDKVRTLRGVEGNPAAESFDDSKWKTMPVPSFEGWEAVGFEGLDGAVWFRTSFELPKQWEGKPLVLDLNRIRNYDLTYLNGRLVGTMDSDDARRYVIPANALHAGRNVIAIQVINYDNKGGIGGYKDTSRHIGVYPEGNEQMKLSLNRQWKYFIQDDQPPAVGVYQASYQPFGDLWIRTPHEGSRNYRRSLDMSKAIATTQYEWNGVRFTREYFVTAPGQALVVSLTADRKGQISCELVLNSPHKQYELKKIDDSTLALSVKVRNGVLHGESQLRVSLKGGRLFMQDSSIRISGADAATIYVTAGTSYRNYKDAGADPMVILNKGLKSLKGRRYEQVKKEHIAEYQQHYNRFRIRLGNPGNDSLPTDVRLARFAASDDPAFVALYLQYGRYLLISSSRPGTKPANLQGIWNDLLAPPWGSKYTTNINAEMNYWPAEILNLSDMHRPLFDMIKELAAAGAETAKEYYNAPGWVLHHNTDLWRGTAAINASNHGIWVTGGAWLSEHLWEHYLFTKDKSFLANEAYPLMKGAAQFFNHFLVKDPKSGWLISTPSNSPEQGGLVAGPTMDHQIIRSLFRNVISAAELLNTDKLFRDSLREKLQRIAPNQIGRHGQLQEWLEDKDDINNRHRHISHLWGMYPGAEINWDETPELMKAARQSLIYRGDAATGWSLGWKINCWARFKDGDHAFQLIRMLLSPSKGGAGSYVNLFDAHPPFQIDGNFGGAAGIGELLLQSHTRFTDILPALPAALSEGEVSGLCARGGFEFKLKWRQGQLQEIGLLSKAGGPITLRYKDRVKTIQTTKNKRYRINGRLQII